MTLTIGTSETGTFALPDTYVTGTAAILATKRSGKSNTGTVLGEAMFDAGFHFVILDAKGDYYGMRSNADGTGEGLAIPIFGGLRGDVPLDPHGGAAMAKLIFDLELSCILDVSRFESKAEQARFLTDFANTIYRLHQEHPRALHLILEEANEYLPQQVSRDDGMTKCVGAWTKLIRLGGSFGLGCTLITQRAADLNKGALTQIDIIIVHRIGAALDKKAVAGWLGEKDEQADIIPTLSALAPGEAWIVSPLLGLVERVKVRRRRTFDSGATPVVGVRRKPPATLADIDVTAIAARMEEQIERAAQDDPVKLREQIADLRRQLAAREPVVEVQERLVPFLPEEVLAAALLAQTAAGAAVEVIRSYRPDHPFPEGWDEAAAAGWTAAAPADLSSLHPPGAMDARGNFRAVDMIGDDRLVVTLENTRTTPPPGGRKQGAPAKILNVVAQHPNGVAQAKLALLSGYAPGKSTLRNALSTLSTRGLITRQGGLVFVTPEGKKEAGDPEPFPTGRALADYWLAQLSGAPEACFRAVVAAYPRTLTPEQVAETAGYEAGTSTVRNAMSKLRTLDLVRGWAANPELFDAP